MICIIKCGMKSYVHSQTINGCTIKFWECRSNFIPRIVVDVIIYPCWDVSTKGLRSRVMRPTCREIMPADALDYGGHCCLENLCGEKSV